MSEIFDADFVSWVTLLALGALKTVEVTLCALIIGALIGSVVASFRLARNVFLRKIAGAYTTVFRGIPELLVIYLIYFGGPAMLNGLSSAIGYGGLIDFPSFVSGALAVGIVSGAYQAEIYRGAYLALSRGELEAASAIGMSRGLRIRRIIIPQIVRVAFPSLGNVWQLTLKDSALVSVTGVVELMRASQVAAGSTNNYFLYFVAGAALYLTLTALSDQVFKFGERMTDKGRSSGSMGRV
jgi:octopine/nopaline transport system permease protein